MTHPQLTSSWNKKEKLKVFSLRSGTIQACLLSPLSFNIVLGVLATEIRQQGKNKRHPNWKGSKTVIIYRWHDIVYREP